MNASLKGHTCTAPGACKTRDLFDPRTYPRAEIPNCCFACRKPFVKKPKDGIPEIGLNIRKDLRSLGLKTPAAPNSAGFCMDCAVSYMNEFNAFLDVVKEME